jgi:hypothetical protein
MDEHIRRLEREVRAGRADPLQLAAALRRGGHDHRTILLDLWNELLQQEVDPREHQWGKLRDYRPFIPWLRRAVEIAQIFPAECQCSGCLVSDAHSTPPICPCVFVDIKCPSECFLCDPRGFLHSEEARHRKCNRKSIEPGAFALAVEIDEETGNPRVVCNAMHWIPSGIDEDGMRIGGYDDIEILSLGTRDWGSNTMWLSGQTSEELKRNVFISWIMKHSTCRIPPPLTEEEEEEERKQWEWRDALAEHYEFGSPLPPGFRH